MKSEVSNSAARPWQGIAGTAGKTRDAAAESVWGTGDSPWWAWQAVPFGVDGGAAVGARADDHGDLDHAAHEEGDICALPALTPDFAGYGRTGARPWHPTLERGPEGVTFDSALNLETVPAAGVGVSYGDTFRLHSNPDSQFRVYLDFDGHTTTGTSWNTYWNTATINSPAFSTSDGSANFSASELTAIQQIWQRVAEDFAPFNIDVTTEDPGLDGLSYSGAGDTAFGIRVVITDEDGKNFGGIAYVGSFDWNSDTPAYVYANRLSDGASYIAEAASHEAGHTLGLSHDGQDPTSQSQTGYYYGHGSGVTDWAPIMGVGYNANVTQWSKGEYLNSNQKQDDLAIVTSQNSGVSYRPDDHGNTFAAAASLSGSLTDGNYKVETYGLISRSGTLNDLDVFSLNVGGAGTVSLSLGACTPVFVSGSSDYSYVPLSATNLDIRACLYDLSGNLIAESNSTSNLGGTISASGLATGTYYLTVDGTSFGSPLANPPTGYTDYGSLGNYMITGTYTFGAGSGSGSGGGSTPAATLAASKASVSTSEGGSSERFTISAANATAPVVVTVGGLDATEGALRTATGTAIGSSFTLDASNGWALELELDGVDDRSDDGDIGYALAFSAAGMSTVSVAASNRDDDLAPTSTGTAVGTWRSAPSITSGNSVSAIGGDDSTSMVLREGTLSGSSSYRLDWMWKFTGVAAGDYELHLDATSSQESFVFAYSTSRGASWSALGAASRTWSGDFDVGAVGSGELWVKVTDAATSGDRSRSTISVDLVTIEMVGSAAESVQGIDYAFSA